MNNIKSTFVTKKRGYFYVAMDYYDNGKLKQKLLKKFDKKKDADKYLIDIKSQINNNKYILPSSITFVDRCTQYYTDKAKNYSPTTMKRYKGVINSHVSDFFKDTKLSDMNISRYQNFINYMFTTKNLKSTTIKEILMKTNAVLRECYRLREINENIPEFITVPKQRKEPSNIDVYTVEESKKILSESFNKPTLQIPLHLFLLAGLRFGEMAGLLWEDVDFENKVLKIQHNLVYVDGVYYLRRTKTDGSNRELIVPDIIIDLLKKEKLRQNKLKLQGLLQNEWDVVCINSRYRYWNNESFRSAYITYLKSINLRYIHIHSLRHAHATMLLLAGTDMKTVSERLGHTEINITMNIYSHVLKEMDKKASDNIEKILL